MLTLDKIIRTDILDQPLPTKSIISNDLHGEVLCSHSSDRLLQQLWVLHTFKIKSTNILGLDLNPKIQPRHLNNKEKYSAELAFSDIYRILSLISVTKGSDHKMYSNIKILSIFMLFPEHHDSNLNRKLKERKLSRKNENPLLMSL